MIKCDINLRNGNVHTTLFEGCKSLVDVRACLNNAMTFINLSDNIIIRVDDIENVTLAN